MARTRTLAQPRQERRTPLKLRGQRFDRAQSRGTDVVFHSFDVVVNDLLIQAEQRQKIGEELVPSSDVASESFARGREDQAAIFFVLEEAVGIEALDHVGHAGLGNLQAGRDIDNPRVTLGIDQLQDALEVILDRGRIAFGIFPGGGHGSARLTAFRGRSK